jgi:hypothetical protein
VNPNSADFEPEKVTTAYAYISAYIPLFLDLKQEGDIFLPGVSLYGSKYLTGSLRRLGSGESVKIRARTTLKPVSPNNTLKIPPHMSVKASLLLQQENVSQRNGGLHEDSKQIVPQITSSNAKSLSLEPPYE